jgi:hypothetical protein
MSRQWVGPELSALERMWQQVRQANGLRLPLTVLDLTRQLGWLW